MGRTGKRCGRFIYIKSFKAARYVITEDIGLAAGCLAKHAYVLTSRGKEIIDDEINLFLETRHLNAKARRSGNYEKGQEK